MAMTVTFCEMNIESLNQQNKELDAQLDAWHEVKTEALAHDINVAAVEENISEIAKQAIKNGRLIDVFQQLIEALR
jgi:uncharacterized protein YigA (DUF484 family)